MNRAAPTDRILGMAMLTHEVDRTFRSSEKRQLIMPDAAAAYLATIKRVCVVALTLLLAGGLLAGGIALKTAIYFSRFHLGTG
jgi:hypothetical protein